MTATTDSPGLVEGTPPPSLPRTVAAGLAILWAMACALALIGLGGLPLRDWDEGTVARVAWELSQAEGAQVLLPTLWGKPYINKPPGLHALIGTVLRFWAGSLQPPEGLVRLVPALLSSLVVPLTGLVQWRLRPGDRLACLASAAVALSLLPVARHGRLAMLDGTQLSLTALFWWMMLGIERTPADRWRALAAGLAASAMLLLKAPLLIPVAAAAALPLLIRGELRARWRLPQACWLGAGLVPGLLWHGWHGIMRGADALWLWSGDGAGRVLLKAGEGSDLGWRVPLIEVLEGGWPWLALWPFGLAWAWRERRQRWGAWALSLQLVLGAVILALRTQLPWYSHSLWLPFALICGPVLAWLIERSSPMPPYRSILNRVPVFWLGLGLLLVLAAAGTAFGLIPAPPELAGVALVCGLGWSLGGLLLARCSRSQRGVGAASMVTGSWLSLALLFQSPLWLWELQETWSVAAPAALARGIPGEVRVLGHDERPSLNWYAGKRIRRGSRNDPKGWMLMGPASNRPIAPADCLLAARSEDWQLLNCDPRVHPHSP